MVAQLPDGLHIAGSILGINLKFLYEKSTPEKIFLKIIL